MVPNGVPLWTSQQATEKNPKSALFHGKSSVLNLGHKTLKIRVLKYFSKLALRGPFWEDRPDVRWLKHLVNLVSKSMVVSGTVTHVYIRVFHKKTSFLVVNSDVKTLLFKRSVIRFRRGLQKRDLCQEARTDFGFLENQFSIASHRGSMPSDFLGKP